MLRSESFKEECNLPNSAKVPKNQKERNRPRVKIERTFTCQQQNVSASIQVITYITVK
jgi:hypothetical protein